MNSYVKLPGYIQEPHSVWVQNSAPAPATRVNWTCSGGERFRHLHSRLALRCKHSEVPSSAVTAVDLGFLEIRIDCLNYLRSF